VRGVAGESAVRHNASQARCHVERSVSAVETSPRENARVGVTEKANNIPEGILRQAQNDEPFMGLAE
jgi:hypothetical protein